MIRCVLLLAVLLACSACSSSGGPAAGPGGENSLTLAEALAAADQLSVPGISGAEAEALRDGFRAGLLASGKSKFSSATPSVDPQDVAIVRNPDSSVSITWSYLNPGDYNQDGVVNISDLTPLGAYLGQTSSDPGWLRASVADGDGSGSVTVADVFQIGANFMNTVRSYSFLPYDENGTLLGEYVVPLADSAIPVDGGVRQFRYDWTERLRLGYSFSVYSRTGTGEVAGEEFGPGSNQPVFNPTFGVKPLNVTATQGDVLGYVRLTWDPVPGADSYLITWGPTQDDSHHEDTFSAPGVTVADSNPGLFPGQSAWFRVVAWGPGGGPVSDPSDAVSGFPLPWPTSPGTLVVSQGAYGDAVELKWDDSDWTEHTYVLRSEFSGGDFEGNYDYLGTAVGNATSWLDTTVVPGVTYYYKVEPVNGAGASESNEAAGYATAAAGAPVIASVAPLTGTAGATVTFAAVNTGGPVDTWTWDFGGAGAGSGDTLPEVQLGPAGSYNCSVTATNAQGSVLYNFTLQVEDPSS